MRAVIGVVSLAALSLVLGADVGGVAAKPKHASVFGSCPAAPSAGGSVGTVTNVLHSKLYVGSTYVGATPFDILSGSFICTDDTGEAVFDLARSNRSVICAALQLTVIQVTPSASLTANVQRGTTWCSIRPSDGPFAAPIGTLRVAATRQTIVGIVVASRTAVIKVVEGSVSLSTRRLTRATVSRSRQVLVFISGTSKPGPLTLSSEERVAIAQLRLAKPTTG
jgi:hypothetical protein